jgi:hypothetical protein
MTESDSNNDAKENMHPKFWEEGFKGSPISVVVPPYIRFLEGLVVQRHALNFLHAAKGIANTKSPELLKVLSPLEESNEARMLEVSYETYFASHLTNFLVSEMEHFFGSAISAALRLHPEKMGSQKFNLKEILSASSNDELIDRAANSVMNKLMYEKPLDYLKGLAEILSIKTDTIEPLWPKYIELKARRDIGAHGNWVVNEIYLRKLSEAKIPTEFIVNDRIIPDFNYLETALVFCGELASAMSNALGEKWVKVKDEKQG